MVGDGPDNADGSLAAGDSDGVDAVTNTAGNDEVSGEPVADDSSVVQGGPVVSGSETVPAVRESVDGAGVSGLDGGEDNRAADTGIVESKNSADDVEVSVPVPAPAADLETIVRDVLTRTYGRYWHVGDKETLARVVEILNDTALVKDPHFEAASRVRAALWQGTVLGGPSAAATCNVFFAVGREDELGSIARAAADYTAGIIY